MAVSPKKMVTRRKSDKKRSYVLLVNTKSRRGADWFAAARARLHEEKDIHLLSAEALTDTSKLDDTIKRLLGMKPDVFVIGGGDGTVSAAVDFFVDESTALALLPLGTTNNFARTMGLPLDLDSALDVMIEGKIISADLAKAGDNYFANVASLGLSTNIARAVTDTWKKRLGRVAYAVAGLRELIAHRMIRVRIEADGTVHNFKTHQLVIANGSHHSGIKIAGGASAQSGKLLVFTMDDGSKWRLIKNFISFNVGGIDKLSGHQVLTATKVILHTRPKRRLELDGELAMRTPVTIRCVPAALRIVVSKNSAS